MRCTESERLISDALDGALSEKKGREVRAHLAGCPRCRAYQESLVRIQTLSQSLEKPSLSPDYLERFSASVEIRLRRREKRAGLWPALRPTWKWAWLAVPVFLAAVLGLALFWGRGETPPQDIYSFENLVRRLDHEIGENAELAERVSGLIASAVVEGLDFPATEAESFFAENALFWEALSEEELRLLDEAIRKEIQS
ncbi:MAG: zf-HC2 domain-containing protein [Acidobacteriota bacterium]